MTTITPRTGRPGARPGISRNVRLTVGGLIAVIAIVIIAVLATGGDGDPADLATAQAAHIPISGVSSEVSPVDIDGELLVRFEGRNDPAIGATVPNVTAAYFDDGERSIDFADGTPRALLFLAHWCPHCQAEVRTLTDHWETTPPPAGIEIIGVSTSVDRGAPNYPPSAWLLDAGWPVPVLRDSADGDFAQAFGLSSYPFFVFIDGDGTVVQRHAGNLEPDIFTTFADTVAG